MTERFSTDRNIAVVLGGGTGERMRQDIPKQLLKLAGKAIMGHTLHALQESGCIDEIIIMMTIGYTEEAEKLANQYPKVSVILEGGSTRNETSKKAIDYISKSYDDCNVLFHDAVRPFVSNSILNDCVDALATYNAVDVVIPSADTIIETDGKVITNIPDRSRLRRGQTPQAFKLATIRQAYELAANDKSFKATDDCGVVLKYLPDTPIGIVEGHESNMKVTQPLDMVIADRLFQMQQAEARDLTDDERREGLRDKTVVVFGGSYGIGKDIVTKAREYGANTYGYSRSETNTDVTLEQDIRDALEGAYKETGRIDYVVNTAGQLTISKLIDMSTTDLEAAIRVNYTAPALIAQLAKPYLDKTKGQLLLFTSSSYTRGRENYSLYSSSKAAVVNLTQALAEEWADDEVAINCINPERTATPMRTKAFGEEDPTMLLKSEKVALASIDALIGDLTGQVFDVRVRQ